MNWGAIHLKDSDQSVNCSKHLQNCHFKVFKELPAADETPLTSPTTTKTTTAAAVSVVLFFICDAASASGAHPLNFVDLILKA